MKKRLLITSIVMMLVVAVALSTATYAWFTSNAKVEASSMTLKAGVSDASALGIGWTGRGANTAISSPVYGAALQPMAPLDLTPTTTVAETLTFYTSTTKQEGGVYLFNSNATVDGDDSDEIADGLVTPVTYAITDGNFTASSFYIKNLSNANEITSVTVKAVFQGDAAYTKLESGTFDNETEYYKKEGNSYVLMVGEPVQEPEPEEYTKDYRYGDSITQESGVYIYTPYILTKDTNAKKGTTYYTLSGNTYTPAVLEENAALAANTYYEKITADDMIRVALFTKEYRQATEYASETTYFAYDPIDDVIKSVSGITAQTWRNDLFTVTNNGQHKLLGVLGHAATVGTAVGQRSFDLNEVYFTESNGVYTQATTITSSNFNDNKSSLYTCENTAVFGTITANKAVNAMSYYADVKTSIEFASHLKPGEQVDIIAYAWLDGTVLDDDRQGELGTVALEFSAN